MKDSLFLGGWGAGMGVGGRLQFRMLLPLGAKIPACLIPVFDWLSNSFVTFYTRRV